MHDGSHSVVKGAIMALAQGRSRHRRRCANLLALALCIPAHAAAAGPDSSVKSASSTFGFLKQVLKRPDAADWSATVRAAGLVPWSGHEGMWHLEAPDGEVRAEAVFRGAETNIFLLFFPAARSALGDATLSWMYRTTASYSFEDADAVELTFADESITGGTGRRRQSFLISLTSGTLKRTVVTLQWK